MTYSIFRLIVSGMRWRTIGSLKEGLNLAKPMIAAPLLVWALTGMSTVRTWGEEWSLARDFPMNENDSESTWSFHLDDQDSRIPVFPLLTRNDRDANQIWG